ncbi:hypothetical protein [Spongiactinospora sp. TRM90649]|uniref:SCO3933 family regulatory protein n=1 Tax=Spongiactinospora sp. TRM90649 TaxID=3031114 RepID=UPI0023F8CC09|nr:hypothetical protein [Spongiactinospora sp. TRM90649]MDF5751694.1 hypothetical protein [Spongiactinospora sp. TRM90649]
MRNIPIPVDTGRLRFTCVKPPRPRLLNRETGELKTDKSSGQTIYEVMLSVEDDSDRIELVKIGTVGEPAVSPGDEVTPVGLVGYVWEMAGRWGISYRAATMVPATGAKSA